MQRESDELANRLDQAGQRSGSTYMEGFATGALKSSPQVQKAFSNLEIATSRATAAQRDYDKARKDSGDESERTIKASERLAVARLREADAHRSAGSALRAFSNASRDATDSGDQLNDVMSDLSKAMAGMGRIAVPAAIGGLIALAPAIADVIGVAASAAQSIALLPAVVGAAGAAFGTLSLATSGLSQALKDVRDPTKLAEDLYSLSPAAQNVALSIRQLLPAFDELRAATEDAVFTDIGPKLNALSAQFLPTIQNMTTGVGAAFNGMFSQLSKELMTPEIQSDLKAMTDNIIAAFQNLEPAIAPVTRAIADLAAAGSDFLPDLASDIADAAQSFSDFINDARDSGQLSEFMQDGIDTLKELAGLAQNVGELFFAFSNDKSRDDLALFSAAIDGMAKSTDTFIDSLRILRDVLVPVVGVMDGFIWAADKLGLIDLPEATKSSESSHASSAQQFSGLFPGQAFPNAVGGPAGTGPTLPGFPPGSPVSPSSTGMPYFPGLPFQPTGSTVPPPLLNQWASALPSTTSSLGLGTNAIINNPDHGGWTPTGGPLSNPGASVPKTPKGSDKDRRDAIIMGLDPSLWQVDPFAGVQGGAPGPMSPFTGTPYGAAQGQDVLEAGHNVESQAHDLEEARKQRLALERDNTATAKEIEDAKWKETQAGWALQKAQAALVDKQRGTTKDLQKGMEDLGVALDPDFGLSKGLSGLADNLVRFIGKLALAPMNAQASAIAANSPYQGGFGLLGINGANNMAQGLSPLFGNPYPQGAYGAAGYGSGYGQPGYGNLGGYRGDAALLASVPPGRYSQEGGRDLLKGLSDCSSSIGDLVNLMDGQTSGTGGNLTTGNAASWLPAHGFVPNPFGSNVPGAFNVGYNAGHMQATLPGGTNFNYGSDSAAANRGIGGSGATDPAFTQHYYRPVATGSPYGAAQTPTGQPAATTAAPTAAAPSSTTPTGGGSILQDLANMFTGGGGGHGMFGQGPMLFKDNPPDDGQYIEDGGQKYHIPAGAPHWDPRETAKTHAPVPYGWDLKYVNGVTELVRRTDIPQAPPPMSAGSPFGGLQTSGNADPTKPIFDLPPGGGAPFGGSFAGRQGYGNVDSTKPTFDLPPGGGTPLPGMGLPAIPGMGGTPPMSGMPSSPFTTPPTPGFIGPVAPAGTTGATGPSASPATPGGIPHQGTGAPPGPGGWTPEPDPTPIGGLAPSVGAGGPGGVGITPGGTIDSALGMAAGAFPGVGQAVQTGAKLANRAVQYAGQLAGIGVSGLMETFLPTGGSELANNGWFARIIGGLAGAKPALPNIAGGKNGGQQAPPPLTPEQATNQHLGTGAPPGPQVTNNIDYHAHNQTEDQNGNHLAYQLNQAYAPAGVP